MIYKIKKHVFDCFDTEGFTVDESRYYVYKRPWWRFWKWELDSIYENEIDAIEFVCLEKTLECINEGE